MNDREGEPREPNSAARLARHWIETWQRGEPEKLALAPEFKHTSPFGVLEGRERYLEVVVPLSKRNVQSLEIRDVFGQGDRAVIIFDVRSGDAVVRSCDLVRVRGEQIVEVESFYDPRAYEGLDEPYGNPDSSQHG